jgi:fucose permease
MSRSYLWLASGVAVMAVGLGGLEALLNPLVAELHPRNVETHLNILHAFFPGGLIVCSLLIGGALDSGVSWRVPFRVAAVPALVVGLLFMTGRYADGGRPRRVRLGLRAIGAMPMFWLLALGIMLGAGCEGSFVYWTPNFLQAQYGAPAVLGAAGLVLFSGAMMAGRLGMGMAVRHVPLEGVMVGLALVGAAASASFALLESLAGSLALLVAAGLCLACFWPCILSLAARHIAADSATLFAMLSVAGILGFGSVPFAVGAIAGQFGLRAGLCLVPVTFLGVASVLLIVRRAARARRAPERAGD